MQTMRMNIYIILFLKCIRIKTQCYFSEGTEFLNEMVITKVFMFTYFF